jgi:hypothetical protein
MIDNTFFLIVYLLVIVISSAAYLWVDKHTTFSQKHKFWLAAGVAGTVIIVIEIARRIVMK